MWKYKINVLTLFPPVPTAFILYRQHHQAGVVVNNPGLANPDISKIIGEHWREEDEPTKNYWKRLAEDEKARHQRQYPQYKYQPRRGGKGGAAARAASAAGEGGDPGRCPKCGGRYIATPRTPSTPFGGIPGPGQGPPGGPTSSGANMQPFITNNPRVVETLHHHQQPHSHHRQSLDSQHGGGDPRRLSNYYPHPPEPLRPIDEDYEGMPPSMSRRRGPQQDEYDMVTSPDVKRRRFGQYDRSPEHHGSPMSAIPLHHHQGQQQYHPSMMSPHQPYPPQLLQQPHPGPRRGSAVSAGGPMYSGQPGGGNYQMSAPLPRPREVVGGPRGPQTQQQQQVQQQQQQRERDMGMAPPPRPPRLSTAAASGSSGGVPPPPPGLPAPPRTGQSKFDESLTLAPLQIPSSPTQASETSSGPRSMSGGGPVGLGMMVPTAPGQGQGQPQQQQQMLVQPQQRGAGAGDSQARGIEAMVMSIPYMNKLDVLRKISPPLGPPGPASPAAETRGPVIAIEGADAALLKEVRAVIERALRSSGECQLRVWTDPSADQALTPPPPPPPTVPPPQPPSADGKKGEDVEMADAAAPQKKTSLAAGPSRHDSVSGGGGGGGKTPTPRPGSSSDKIMPAIVGGPASTFDYLRTIMGWHTKSGEIVKYVTSSPAGRTSPDPDDDHSPPSKPTTTTVPVALIADGFSLTLSDRFASTVAITDPYSPVDHWQWMATLWRGIVGSDLVVYVRAMTADEAARNSGTVEYRAPGVMVVRVAGDRVDEKTERRLAFEVMEWVRAGSFRDGYLFGGGPEGN